VAMQIVREYERLQAVRLGHAPPARSPVSKAKAPGVRP
jgi:hypothetical protein